MMTKPLFLAALGLWAIAIHANGQTLRNTTWRTMIPGPPDSVTLHIGNDSSVASIGDEIVAKSLCHISNDTLTLEDYDGAQMCPNIKGVYRFILKDDKLILNLVHDDCDGRAGAINGAAWIRVKTHD